MSEPNREISYTALDDAIMEDTKVIQEDQPALCHRGHITFTNVQGDGHQADILFMTSETMLKNLANELCLCPGKIQSLHLSRSKKS